MRRFLIAAALCLAFSCPSMKAQDICFTASGVLSTTTNLKDGNFYGGVISLESHSMTPIPWIREGFFRVNLGLRAMQSIVPSTVNGASFRTYPSRPEDYRYYMTRNTYGSIAYFINGYTNAEGSFKLFMGLGGFLGGNKCEPFVTYDSYYKEDVEVDRSRTCFGFYPAIQAEYLFSESTSLYAGFTYLLDFANRHFDFQRTYEVGLKFYL